MAKARKRARNSSPILVTKWLEPKAKNGLVHFYLKSGDEIWEFVCPPHLVMQAMELGRRSLTDADVIPLPKAPASRH